MTEQETREAWEARMEVKGMLRGKIARGWTPYFMLRYEKTADYDRYEDCTRECRGGLNFASTLETVINRSKNPTLALSSTIDALNAIVDKPNAGTVSWEMRRFIRRCNTDQIVRFGQMVRRAAQVYPVEDRLFNFDCFVWDTDGMGKEDLRREVDLHLQGLTERIERDSINVGS